MLLKEYMVLSRDLWRKW